MKIIKSVYTDILNSKKEFNAFKGDRSFNLSNVSAKDIEASYNCIITETFFYGNGKFDESFEFFRQGARDILLKAPIFLFAVEHKPLLRSKLRSYKGLFDKTKISIIDVVECEAMLNNNMSLISAVVSVNENLFEDYLFDFFLDSTTAFVFRPNSQEFLMGCDFNLRTITDAVSIGETVQIDYFKLMIQHCIKGYTIFRVGGDGTGTYWSLQEFSRRDAQ